MVARTPPKHKKMVAPINPLRLRETLTKVDQCMSRLQELHYTVTGGTKVISGVNLSPRSTRGYLRTSLRCKQESLRIKNATPKKSPPGKFPANSGGEWRRMSLPAMLLGETVGEIIQASQFAKEIVAAVNAKSKKTSPDDPKTPVTQRKKQRPDPENSEIFRTRRKREKQNSMQSSRSDSGSPPKLQRVRSRIVFKVSSPPKKRDNDKENARYLAANRVSPKLKPWAKKTVLFPNPLFLSTPSASQQHKFCSKTRSPVIARKRETPHKFLIKTPPALAPAKFQVKIKSPPVTNLSKKSPVKVVSTASKLRRSFSPSRLANRLVSLSPLKSRKSVQKSGGDGLVMNGLKQRPALVSMRRYSIGGRI